MAINTLQTKLNAILTDKQTNLLPENLKKGVTVLGINGTFEGGSARSNIKVFSSVDEMNNSTDNLAGDIALIDDVATNTLTTSAENYSYEVCPGKITVTEEDAAILDAAKGDNYGVTIASGMSGEGNGCELMFYYTSSNSYELTLSGVYNYFSFKKTSSDSAFKTFAGEYELQSPSNGWGTYWLMDFKLDEAYANLSFINNLIFIKQNLIQFKGIYIYANGWVHLPNTLSSAASVIQKGYTYYGGTGLITGTMDLSASCMPIAIKGYPLSEITTVEQTSPITPIDITTVPKDLYCVYNKDTLPELKDKRYFIIYGSYTDPMMGKMTVNEFYTIDNPDAKIIFSYNAGLSSTVNEITSDGDDKWTSYKTSSNTTYASAKPSESASTMQYLAKRAAFEVSTDSTSIAINDNLRQIAEMTSTYDMWVLTNCEIVDNSGNTLVKAGPKASTTLKGQYYMNDFGEIVEGTYEPAPINATEYNTAVTTTQEILGTNAEDSAPSTDTDADSDDFDE